MLVNGTLPLESRADRPYTRQPLPLLTAADTVVLDTETTGLRWFDGHRPVGVAVRTLDGQVSQYISWGHPASDNHDEETVRRWAREQLRGKTIIGHNLQFDLQHMRVWGADLRYGGNTFVDTMILAALLDDHRQRFSLAVLAKDEGLPEKGDLPGDQIAQLPASVVGPYAERDVELAGLIYERYAARLADEGQAAVMALESSVIPATVEMMANGCPLDPDRLAHWQRLLETTRDGLMWEVYRETGRTINPGSPADMGWLFNRCHETPGITATGRPSFTADIVRDAATRHPIIEKVYQIGKIDDLIVKFLVPWSRAQVKGVLYPSLHQLRSDDGGTVSGRYACSAPNLQQVLGKDKLARSYSWLSDVVFRTTGERVSFNLKALFVAPEGEVWVSSDAKAIEMRLFADYSASERLIQMFRDDPLTDLHAVVTEWIRPFRPNVTRTEAKQGSFAKLYGSGRATLAATLGMSEAEVQVFIRAYNTAFPEADQLFRRAMDTAARRGYVRTRLGRRTRFVADPTTGELQRLHKALNGIIQGFAADLNKLMLAAYYERRSALAATMRLTVHDSAESTMPREAVAAYDAFMNEQRYPTQVPIIWETAVGPSWGEVTPLEA